MRKEERETDSPSSFLLLLSAECKCCFPLLAINFPHVHPQDTFPTLTHIIRLDLGKNHLTELPEYFGQLRNLRHLDLYSNELTHLPVSFAQLKNLKWLDLKNNPLVPALQQAAGPCITTSDCALCAKKVRKRLMRDKEQISKNPPTFLTNTCLVANRSWLCCKACRASWSARGRS